MKIEWNHKCYMLEVFVYCDEVVTPMKTNWKKKQSYKVTYEDITEA